MKNGGLLSFKFNIEGTLKIEIIITFKFFILQIKVKYS